MVGKVSRYLAGIGWELAEYCKIRTSENLVFILPAHTADDNKVGGLWLRCGSLTLIVSKNEHELSRN